jgi:5-methyltetrahydropteroyltriglutamate--homocysteine methyltransferase
MTMRSEPPFRADHVGSLLRPPVLLDARAAHARGAIEATELRAIEDQAIRDAVGMQEAIGLQVATDGEFRRASWHMDFIYQLGGAQKLDSDIEVEFHNASGNVVFTPSALRIAAPVTLEHTIFGREFAFVRDAVTTAVPKLTIPSPSMVHYRGGRAAVDETVYPDMDLFWDDLTAAYREEIASLGELGCTYLQLDDTSLAYLNDPAQRDHVIEIGGDPDHQHEFYIRRLNEAIASRPEGMTITTHLCRGNFRSSWFASGGYEHVAEVLLNELQVHGFFLEYDDQRSGGFEPLRFLPPGKFIVLGLVTTKSGELESKDELMRRIEQAAKFADIDQLCLSPQCGFSSTVDGNDLSMEQQAAKLSLVVETAREVWGSA